MNERSGKYFKAIYDYVAENSSSITVKVDDVLEMLNSPNNNSDWVLVARCKQAKGRLDTVMSEKGFCPRNYLVPFIPPQRAPSESLRPLTASKKPPVQRSQKPVVDKDEPPSRKPMVRPVVGKPASKPRPARPVSTPGPMPSGRLSDNVGDLPENIQAIIAEFDDIMEESEQKAAARQEALDQFTEDLAEQVSVIEGARASIDDKIVELQETLETWQGDIEAARTRLAAIKGEAE
ncbi:SH3 domain [Carpediemonas membranifera]|uniref:SH3 domain n=1 Tax=Carpediemonas membranifera TaxID=201153 RepID=A0A8J6DZ74_9EUKA|nr:SH3 domain [Carpediemonas membranifera]|eukprot:KAG9393249.1 SH3 domain [Carpediemonas membranifera]